VFGARRAAVGDLQQRLGDLGGVPAM